MVISRSAHALTAWVADHGSNTTTSSRCDRAHHVDGLAERLVEHGMAMRRCLECLLGHDHRVADDHAGLAGAIFAPELVDLGQRPQQHAMADGKPSRVKPSRTKRFHNSCHMIRSGRPER